MRADEFTYLLLMMVITVDTLGVNFSVPILVPYGESLGASMQTIGLGSTLRFAMNTVSLVWMPIASDKFGRRVLIAISVAGSGVAYFMQGISAVAGKVPMWVGGRMVAGFFGGTAPVVGAFLIDISMPDAALMKKRMVMLQVTQTSFGLMLGPICGVLANYSLELPYYVSAGAAAFVLVLVVLFLRDYAKHHKKKTDDPQILAKQQMRKPPKTEKIPVVEKEEGNPWKDPVLLLLFVGSAFILNFVMGNILLIPKILEEESFGLQGKDDKETKRKIASAMGIVGLPGGLASVAASAFLYVPLSNMFGDVPVIIGGCSLGCAASLAFAYIPEKLWHVAALQLVLGLGFGVLTPAIGPTVARHVGYHYVKQNAVANSIPMFGATFAGLVSQLLMATIYEELGMKAAWWFGVICVAIFAVLYLIAHRIILANLPPDLNTSRKTAESKLGGYTDADKFIEKMLEDLKHELEANKEQLWNSTVTTVLNKNIAAACECDVRVWDEKTEGQEYLQDLLYYLQDSPEELVKFRKAYPDIGRAPGDETCALKTHLWMSV